MAAPTLCNHFCSPKGGGCKTAHILAEDTIVGQNKCDLRLCNFGETWLTYFCLNSDSGVFAADKSSWGSSWSEEVSFTYSKNSTILNYSLKSYNSCNQQINLWENHLFSNYHPFGSGESLLWLLTEMSFNVISDVTHFDKTRVFCLFLLKRTNVSDINTCHVDNVSYIWYF